jgi:hypothetical protein
MFVKALVAKCEFSGRKYDTFVEGAYVVFMDANGRAVDVVEAGPEYIKQKNAYVREMRDVSTEMAFSIRNLACF